MICVHKWTYSSVICKHLKSITVNHRIILSRISESFFLKILKMLLCIHLSDFLSVRKSKGEREFSWLLFKIHSWIFCDDHISYEFACPSVCRSCYKREYLINNSYYFLLYRYIFIAMNIFSITHFARWSIHNCLYLATDGCFHPCLAIDPII